MVHTTGIRLGEQETDFRGDGMSFELSQVLVAFAIAFFGGTASWILQQLKMESEAKGLQMIIAVLLAVIFIRYAIQLYGDIQTFARY